MGLGHKAKEAAEGADESSYSRRSFKERTAAAVRGRVAIVAGWQQQPLLPAWPLLLSSLLPEQLA